MCRITGFMQLNLTYAQVAADMPLLHLDDAHFYLALLRGSGARFVKVFRQQTPNEH